MSFSVNKSDKPKWLAFLFFYFTDMYFLAGGKIDDEGSICSGLEVEIKEETGINIDLSNGQPFLLVQQYVSYYPKRDNQGFSNRLSETFYFIIHNNDEIKVEEMSLTEKEKKGNFSVFRIHPSDIKGLLSSHTTNNPRNEFFTRELLAVLDKYIDKGLSFETEKRANRFYHS